MHEKTIENFRGNFIVFKICFCLSLALPFFSIIYSESCGIVMHLYLFLFLGFGRVMLRSLFPVGVDKTRITAQWIQEINLCDPLADCLPDTLLPYIIPLLVSLLLTRSSYSLIRFAPPALTHAHSFSCLLASSVSHSFTDSLLRSLITARLLHQ